VILLFLQCNILFTLPFCKDIVNMFNINKIYLFDFYIPTQFIIEVYFINDYLF
jgi:hypothetical protein